MSKIKLTALIALISIVGIGIFAFFNPYFLYSFLSKTHVNNYVCIELEDLGLPPDIDKVGLDFTYKVGDCLIKPFFSKNEKQNKWFSFQSSYKLYIQVWKPRDSKTEVVIQNAILKIGKNNIGSITEKLELTEKFNLSGLQCKNWDYIDYINVSNKADITLILYVEVSDSSGNIIHKELEYNFINKRITMWVPLV